METARLYALAFFLCTLTLASIGQQSPTCTIIDSVSKAPVAYASISAGRTAVYADVLGRFGVEAIEGDTCTISRIGYETLRLPKSALKGTILLVPQTYGLQEVVISGSTESFEVGNHRLKTIGTSMLLSNYTHALYIPAPPRQSTVKAVFVHTKGNSKGDPYVLSFFKVGENFEPSDLIYSRDFEAPSGKNMLNIPVDDVEITMPEAGIFVGISRKEVSDIENDVLVYSTLTLAAVEEKQHSFILKYNRWVEQLGTLSEGTTYKIGLLLSPR